MYEIDKEAFGTFLSQLRKEKGMTQKDLAQQLFVSDKAVSKWERGLSLPDVTLLQPLTDLLGVTISELLRGQRIPQEESITAQEADRLVSGALHLSTREQAERREIRRRWVLGYVLAALLGALEMLSLWKLTDYMADDFASMLLTPLLLAAIFGLYFCFFAREQLPAFYDENKINFYSDGIFQMNVPGVRFNNSNWPHILQAARTWCIAMMTLYIPLYAIVRWASGFAGSFQVQLGTMLIFGMATLFGGLFIPIFVVGRKYQ